MLPLRPEDVGDEIADGRAVLERDESVSEPFGEKDRAARDAVELDRLDSPESGRADTDVDDVVDDLPGDDGHVLRLPERDVRIVDASDDAARGDGGVRLHHVDSAAEGLGGPVGAEPLEEGTALVPEDLGFHDEGALNRESADQHPRSVATGGLGASDSRSPPCGTATVAVQVSIDRSGEGRVPKASVIMPVHNRAPTLEHSLRSVLAQTLDDFELICVDDGSTDTSADLLRAAAQRDSRIILLSQSQGGAGAARNRGLERASGDYLSFFDADDLVEPHLLERVTGHLDATGADLCLYGGTRFVDGEQPDPSGRVEFLRADYAPDSDPFSPQECAERIFQLATPAAWLRMFRRSFIEREGLRFQQIARSNDLAFTSSASAAADTLTVLNEVLVHYRTNQHQSLQTKLAESPLDIVAALARIHQFLDERNLLIPFARSFHNQCASVLLHNLKNIRHPAAYVELHNTIRTQYLDEFGLRGHDADYFYNGADYRMLQHVESTSGEDSLLQSFSLREENFQLRQKIARATTPTVSPTPDAPSFPRRVARAVRRRTSR